MIQLLLLFGLVLLVVIAVQRFLQQAPAGTGKKFRRALLLGGLIVALLLAAMGRLGVLIPVIAALIAAVLRLLPVLIPMLLQSLPHWRRWRQQQAARQTAGGDGADASTVESRFLRMRLDHASGEIAGEVLAGPFAGQRLSELDRHQLADLYAECLRDDQESATLLRAYLERVYGEAWETSGAAPNGPPPDGRMTADEARAVLGLTQGASRDDIVAAHRRLMQKLHPDRGGSDYLAAKINQAKDLLLGR